MDTKLREVERTLPGHWTQGPPSRWNGDEACLMGHLAMAHGLSAVSWSALQSNDRDLLAIACVIKEQYPAEVARQYPQLPDRDLCWLWQDEARRTEDEVVTVVQKARIMLECEI